MPSKICWSATTEPTPATPGWSWALILRAPVGHISPAPYVLPEAHVSPRGSVGFGLRPASRDDGPGRGEAASPGGMLREAEAAESAEQTLQEQAAASRYRGRVAPPGRWRFCGADRARKIGRSDDCRSTCAEFPVERRLAISARGHHDCRRSAGPRSCLTLGAFETVGKRILIAWDGTREANRALHDALPLFTDPEATVVFGRIP